VNRALPQGQHQRRGNLACLIAIPQEELHQHLVRRPRFEGARADDRADSLDGAGFVIVSGPVKQVLAEALPLGDTPGAPARNKYTGLV